jgi:Flp pilus assembly protein TadG
MRILKNFRQWMNRYAQDTSGATLMAFALSVPVVVGAMGVSVDLARSYLMKERLSHALDAAALAGAGSASLEGDALEARIQAFFDRNMQGLDGIELVITQNGSTLQVSAAVPLDTSFMKVLGISEVDISNSAVVQREVRGVGRDGVDVVE